jgi:hypothetical protein
MSRKIFLDAFYGQFHDFLDQLIRVFPDDSDFPAYKSGLTLLQKTNPKLVPEQVFIHVTPFEQGIRARDEKFFLEHQFPDYADDNALDLIISKMKDLWTTLSTTSKTVVWDYLILLLDLAKRCAA